MDVTKLKVVVNIDAKDSIKFLKVMRAIRQELQTKLPFVIASSSDLQHFLPSRKLGVSSNKFRKLLISNFLSVFDTACINHFLKGLVISVLPNKIIGE